MDLRKLYSYKNLLFLSLYRSHVINEAFRPALRTNNKLNPHMTSSPGIEPGPHWWKASALTTAPSLLPQQILTGHHMSVR